MEEIGSAKSSFYIQYGQIVSIISEEPHNLSGMKVAGSNLPNLLEVGTYLSGTEKQFWYIKKRKYDFLILVLKSNFYSKVILELENSNNISMKISELIGRGMK